MVANGNVLYLSLIPFDCDTQFRFILLLLRIFRAAVFFFPPCEYSQSYITVKKYPTG